MKNSIQRIQRFRLLLKVLLAIVCALTLPVALRPVYAQHSGGSMGGGHMGGGHFAGGHFGTGAHGGHAMHSPHLTYVPSRSMPGHSPSSLSPFRRRVPPGLGIPLRNLGNFGFRSHGRFGGFWPYGYWPFWDDWGFDSCDSYANGCNTQGGSQNSAADDAQSDDSVRPIIVFYMRDGSGYAALDYWLVNGVLHIETSYGTEKSFPFDEVDLQRTSKEASERGVVFTLRAYPSASAPGPMLAQDSYAPPCEAKPEPVASVSPVPSASTDASSRSEVSRDSSSGFGVTGSPTEGGLRVVSVTPNSPAARAAIRPGDVIFRVDCRQVHNSAELDSALAANNSGSLWVAYLIQSAWLTEKRVTTR